MTVLASDAVGARQLAGGREPLLRRGAAARRREDARDVRPRVPPAAGRRQLQADRHRLPAQRVQDGSQLEADIPAPQVTNADGR